VYSDWERRTSGGDAFTTEPTSPGVDALGVTAVIKVCALLPLPVRTKLRPLPLQGTAMGIGAEWGFWSPRCKGQRYCRLWVASSWQGRRRHPTNLRLTQHPRRELQPGS